MAVGFGCRLLWWFCLLIVVITVRAGVGPVWLTGGVVFLCGLGVWWCVVDLCFRGGGFGLYVVLALVGCFGWWFQGGCCAARFVFAWYFLLTLGLRCLSGGTFVLRDFWFPDFLVCVF